jgi:S-(hydroxymethyl)glutathione dehydrogenase/alcohol dehydrogenase
MRAIVLDRPGGRLAVEHVLMPSPRAGEVLVRVAACGVCHTDLHVMKGEVAFPMPAVLGHEVSGTVAALGQGVGGPALGTAVVAPFIMPCTACRACAAGRDDLCERFFAMNRLRGTLYDGETRLFRQDGTPLAMYSMGGLAEYCVVPESSVFPLPENVPLIEAAVLGCSVFTAYGAVQHAARLRGGERVAVVAAGGIGMNVIQISRAFGAVQVIAVDVRADKLEGALAAGATDAVDASAGDPVSRVVELTGGRGVDVAFEALGRPETFLQAVEMLCDGGRMVAVGIAAGDAAVAVPITRLVRRSLRLTGSYGARTRSDMPRILHLAAAGVLQPKRTVTRHYRLEEAVEAYAALDRGEVVGRAVVVA